MKRLKAIPLCLCLRVTVSYLLVMLDLLQFGIGDDAFELMKSFLHQSEAKPGRLLLLPDSLQLSPPHLLSNTGTLLPLLDPLREDLIDTTEIQTDRQLSLVVVCG